MSADLLRRQIIELVETYAAGMSTGNAFRPGSTPIPPAGKLIGASELSNMVDAVLDGWLTGGRFNSAFERALADHLGIDYVLTTNSGSSANLLAFSALASPSLGERALRPGDEVITVAASFPTTVNPILQNGCVPVFVDLALPTYNIAVERIEDAISDRTRAIMLAHTLGNPFEVDEVCRIAREHGLWLIEDCCDALGSTYDDRPVGGFGDIGTLSFYPAHHITTGEGGAVFTRSAELKRILESLRDWGRDCYCPTGYDNTCGRRFARQLGELPFGYDHKYIYAQLGYNLKITDIQAACGLAQIDRLAEFVDARQRNFAYLAARLAPLQDFLLLPQATPRSRPAWFGFPLTLQAAAACDRVDLLRYLDEHRIGTRLIFAGNLTRQPYMAGRHYRVAGSLGATDRVMNDSFWLGLWPGLSETMLDYVVEKLGHFMGVGL
ncbi:MAG TPA: lipopolysaccharide biosynthesis protein RfbH [Accumulibacter sp.]|uniref:lipopolysaccharide biosynthesis protein RfbH n=2 Tax=Accumulibacter sp. TaxID=2053492 RepID=UPI002C88D5C8|nr:lipopolysaccharide biosynthesis protein RfbH [Accumulibacter sp.]HNL96647.1 lipopolysaccharide biosynthesis protein RfbH [Accumulibacter sp.]